MFMDKKNVIQMAIPPKAICRFKNYIIQGKTANNGKFVEDHKRPHTSKQFWEKRKKYGGIVFLDFEVYYKAKEIKTMLVWKQ